MKFKAKNYVSQSKGADKFYEPMTHTQLAQALDMEDRELVEAFGYFEDTDHIDTVLANTFKDEDYEIDTSGLHLSHYVASNGVENNALEDVDEDKVNQLDQSETSNDDAALAAEFGYFDDVDTFSNHGGGYSPSGLSCSPSDSDSSGCENQFGGSSDDRCSATEDLDSSWTASEDVTSTYGMSSSS